MDTTLDSHTINLIPPAQLAVQLSQLLDGPPALAAPTLRAAAEGGVVQAQLVYGQWLLDGRGLSRDPTQAVQWFEYAARDGEPMALNMLGQCHAHGWGVAVNAFMAAYWYRLAAQGGLDWGMYNYATALTLGQGINTDRPAALRWFLQAAALNHAKSMNMIGSFHEDGWVVAQDIASALSWYQQAAEGGDFRGQFNTARLMLAQDAPLGSPQDADTAIRQHDSGQSCTGKAQLALAWLSCVPQSATPAFLRQAADWLQSYLAHPALGPETSAPRHAIRPHLATLIHRYRRHADHAA